MATDKKYSITIDNLKETIKDVQSLGDALEKSGSNMSEYEKLTQKLIGYDREYQKALQEVKTEIADKNKAVKDEVELEKANLTVQENVQKSYYDKQKVLSALGKQIKSMNTETEEEKAKQQELISQYSSLNQELKDFDASLGNHQRNVGDYRGALRETTQEIRAMQGEMAQMLMNGVDKADPKFQALAKKAGELQDALGDARQEVTRFASDTKKIDDVINIAQSATAAFELYKGTMSAFGIETEGAEEAIQKLMGAMSIIQSLQTLQDTLSQGSATAKLFNAALKVTGAELVTTQLASIKATAAQEGMSKAQKAGAIASKTLGLALKAIPLMLVIGLVATLITHWEDIVGWFNKTFPILSKLGGAFNALKAVLRGVGAAIVNWLINPWETFAKVIKKIFEGDFEGAIKAATDGIKNQFKGTADAFKEGFQNQVTRGLEEISNKTLEETNKQTKYQLDMLKAKLGAEAKYSKEGIALQKKDFEERRKLAKNNKDELNKINVEEASFYRECQEKKTAAAKKSADERKKAEKAASDEAKRLAAEAENKRKEEEKAAEEQRKKELEAAKELSNAKAKGADLEIDNIKATITEKKRLAELDLETSKKEIASVQERIKTLQKIVSNERLTKKTRQEAAAQLVKEEQKLKAVDTERIKNLEKIAELEKDIVKLNQEKSENAVVNELKEQLADLTLTKDEVYKLIDGTSDKLTGYTEAQLQYVKNAGLQMKLISQETATAIENINTKTKNSSTPTETPASGGEEKKKLSPNDPSTAKDFWKGYSAAMQETLFESMDTISMFMDYAIEETERALEEVEDLHDKALDKVNDSADKIKELNENLRDSSNTNVEATKQQLAEEQLLYAQRLAEEQKLAEKEKALKNKAAQQEASARKMELTTQMAMGIANTAQGVTKALATYAPPYSYILAAAVGALGAIQTGLIAAQIAKVKPIKYADGGLLSGPSHSQGGIRLGNVEVEGGEAVINKHSTKRFLPLLDAINAAGNGGKHTLADASIRKYADGGQLNFSMAEENLRAQQQTSRLIGAINDIDMQPIVSVVDIARVQDRLVRVRGLAGR